MQANNTEENYIAKPSIMWVPGLLAERAQLELLLFEGLKEDDYVLEIGFEALMSAIAMRSFLMGR